jgi:lipid II:glycine glycyltransferase (peptidoglycan interpeptide bridge formation enzyme)
LHLSSEKPVSKFAFQMQRARYELEEIRKKLETKKEKEKKQKDKEQAAAALHHQQQQQQQLAGAGGTRGEVGGAVQREAVQRGLYKLNPVDHP